MSDRNDFVIKNGVLEKYVGLGGDVVVPEGVTSIGDKAFYWCESLISIKLPEGVTSIGEYAFSGCKSLISIKLPEGVTSIGGNAFWLCASLTSIELPEGVTSIGEDAFSECKRLTSIELPEGVTSIGEDAFFECKSLTSIKLPEGVTSIGGYAFWRCASLTSIELPEGVTSIGKGAFKGCESITSIKLPERVTSIGDGTFLWCKSLTSIELPEGVTSIGGYVFWDCNQLKQIEIRSDSIEIDRWAFSHSPLKVFFSGASLNVSYDASGFYIDFDYNYPEYFTGEFLAPNLSPEVFPSGWRFAVCKAFLKNYEMYKEQMVEAYCKYVRESFQDTITDVLLLDHLLEQQFLKETEIDLLVERASQLPDMDEVIEKLSEYKWYLSLYGAAKKKKRSKSVADPKNRFKEQEEFKNSLEEYCHNRFEKNEIESIMNQAHISIQCFEKAEVIDLEQEEKVSAFVLACAVVPYMGQLPKKTSATSYRKEYSKFRLIDDCDYIASHFEKTSFEKFLKTLSKFATVYNPQVWIPVGRFGSEEQIRVLIKSLASEMMRDWGRFTEAKRKIIVCRGAILLSNTREALMYAEKCKCLDYYAELRGTTAEEVRDTVLVDLGFDQNGKIIYDLGNKTIEASVSDDLKIVLYDTQASKVVRSLPKRGSNQKKYDLCNADYSLLKKNMKKVVKGREKLLFQYFLSGEKIDYRSWTAVYLENPVLNKIARLLVWAQGEQTFTVNEESVIDSFGNCVELYKDRDVVVAHPVEMDDADLARWQNYFATQKLKQPFEQIWEPKVSGDIKEDRYRGCLIPYYRFMSQEKRGIKTNAYGDDDYSFIEIPIKDCTTEIKRIDWEGKHDIKVTDRFEIQSIHINRLNRRTNHIICYFDKCTIYGKIEQDDESAMKNLERYTVAQIDAFLKYAIEKGSTKCTAVLLNFKNEHFEDFADVDEFTLDF